jgi:hypothetical protein
VSAPANPGDAGLTQRLVADLGAAFQLRAAYAPGHPQVTGALARVRAAHADWCAHAGTSDVSLILLEGHLLVDRHAIPEDAPWARGLLRAFQRHGIRGLTLLTGLDEAELGHFLDGCLGSRGPAPSRHLLVGQAGFSADEDEQQAGSAAPAPGGTRGPSISPEQVEGACAELHAVGTGAVQRVDRLRSFVAQLARSAEAGSLDSLRQLAARVDDREFLHGLAVALATLRVGRALGIEGKPLEDLALGGLVHDVGYLETEGAEEDPARRRRLHPIRGAARLAALEGMPDVAVLVAYEHHLRFDGVSNYPVMTLPRHLVAAPRVVAVADTWETIRSRGVTGIEESLAILRGRAGTFLDPLLVELLAEIVAPPARAPSP